jgi:hypothetical protein
MEYDINPKFDNINIKNIEANISIYKLANGADISIRYVTEEFITDLHKRLGLKLEPKTLGGKKYYVLNVYGTPTNITFWVEHK